MSNRIAVIYEGEKTERILFENIRTIFWKKAEFHFISISAAQNLYMLWNRLKADDFETGVIDVLKESGVDIGEYTGRDFAEIYLFFDYDGHQNNLKKDSELIGDDVLFEMLDRLDNETEHGKLYINYPMIEAIRDIDAKEESYQTSLMPMTDIKYFKKHVGKKLDFQDFRKINQDGWKCICRASVKRASEILGENIPSLDKEYSEFIVRVTQNQIFSEQKNRFIINGELSILSSVPFFLLEYFGQNLWDRFLKGK